MIKLEKNPKVSSICTNRPGPCGRGDPCGNDKVTYCRRVDERNLIACCSLPASVSVTFIQRPSIKYLHSWRHQNCIVLPDCYWHMASHCLCSDFDKSCLRRLGATKWKCHLHFLPHPSSQHSAGRNLRLLCVLLQKQTEADFPQRCRTPHVKTPPLPVRPTGPACFCGFFRYCSAPVEVHGENIGIFEGEQWKAQRTFYQSVAMQILTSDRKPLIKLEPLRRAAWEAKAGDHLHWLCHTPVAASRSPRINISSGTLIISNHPAETKARVINTPCTCSAGGLFPFLSSPLTALTDTFNEALSALPGPEQPASGAWLTWLQPYPPASQRVPSGGSKLLLFSVRPLLQVFLQGGSCWSISNVVKKVKVVPLKVWLFRTDCSFLWWKDSP